MKRVIMLERQREGIQKAKADGTHKSAKALGAAHVQEMKASGIGAQVIVDKPGIARRSVYRMRETEP